ncbi:TetR/AcrR family transcriptional regulator [Microbacterium ureisolvens]|uniref:TetR family transcriptional regulator C-terminal domain-containing protein n=1 Tax=Microbacterium ureisolvens TaxID=2781186 RepID=A0ABS7I1B6_9MICO|nr:TetR family transcriptional regulator C-terminal domain-containing protein [Microbacterium ureisolvens]MBW9110278.1 TetR family transcriptional regulator C-terminal domain-containing protein [Microbacterium ureisolvens]
MSSTSSRPRTRKAPAERAAEIVAAATAIARDQGLSALTLRAVAERAGVASGLVAHYQPSMDDLVARVYADLVDEEVKDVERMVGAVADPAARLGALMDTLMNGGREEMTVVWVEGWAMARRNDALALAVRAQMERWQTLVESIIEDGCRTGAFSTAEPGEVAWELIGMIDGLNAQSLARGTDTTRFAARTARAAEALVGARPGSVAVAS